MMSDIVEIFTDGACSGNPGPGGWAAIIRENGKEQELTGGDPDTTNQRMELMPAITALESLEGSLRIKIYSDSQYLIKGMSEWIQGWKQKGWKKSNKKPVENVDLWKRLDAAAAGHEIEWIKVRGHDNHPENERADKLAVRAIDRYR
jgi:ribonuclease HI